MALKWHPDKNAGDDAQKKKAEKMFKDINEAYVVLSDEEKRRRYDSGVDLEDLDGPGGFSGAGGVDPTQIFQMFFGGGMGGGMDDGGFGGMPGGMFGGMGGGGGQKFFKRSSPGGSNFEFRFG